MHQYPHQLLFKIALAFIVQSQNQSAKALYLMQNAYQQDPKNYLATISYANLLMKNQQYKLAATILEKEENQFVGNETYLSALSQAQGKSANLAGAYETRAKLLLFYNDSSGALIQLHQALQFAKDRYQRARIQFEISQLKLASS